jgi:hypothetical protein
MITQLTGSGYSGRRYGSFSGRAEVIPITPVTETYSGGYFGYDLDRPRIKLKKFRATDKEEEKAKPILEDMAESLDPVNETSSDFELILRLRLREQHLIYKSLYLKWIKKQAEQKKAEIQKIAEEQRLIAKRRRRREEDVLIVALLTLN